jgi:hypothetical protein
MKSDISGNASNFRVWKEKVKHFLKINQVQDGVKVPTGSQWTPKIQILRIFPGNTISNAQTPPCSVFSQWNTSLFDYKLQLKSLITKRQRSKCKRRWRRLVAAIEVKQHKSSCLQLIGWWGQQATLWLSLWTNSGARCKPVDLITQTEETTFYLPFRLLDGGYTQNRWRY